MRRKRRKKKRGREGVYVEGALAMSHFLAFESIMEDIGRKERSSVLALFIGRAAADSSSELGKMGLSLSASFVKTYCPVFFCQDRIFDFCCNYDVSLRPLCR
jgi:hypothetical protein